MLLLIEVADSSVEFDRTVKLAAYARVGIPEVWIAARSERRIESYRGPVADQYTDVQYFGPGESVSPQAFPDVIVEVDRVIGE